MPMPRPTARRRALAPFASALLLVVALLSAACSDDRSPSAAPTLRISSIPDQDPSKLAQRDGAMATYLAGALGVNVEYVPVTDYAAAVTLFRSGDLDLVFFGGLTGVQARLQTPGATLVAQRDIDDAFRSVFIANAAAAIAPVDDVGALKVFRGTRFTFGSESSTSGRLMPEYFLDQAGVSAETDFKGLAGYSGSHDKTVELVAAGTYDAGALNLQVWKSRLEKGSVDPAKVIEVFVTPPYHDYHWLAGPRLDGRLGEGFTERLTAALLALDRADPAQAGVLDGYGAAAFIATSASNYAEIESIGRKLGLIT